MQYINHLYRLHRDHVIVQIAPHQGSAARTVVEAAVVERKRDLVEERKGRGSAYNEYWAVFDVDANTRLDEALALAAANGIKVALSSPCLEVWFLLHDQRRTAYLERDVAQRLSEQFLGCDKILTSAALDLLDEGYKAAMSNAQDLDAKHRGDQTSHPWNPSSNLWELIETIRTGKPLAQSGVPFSGWHLQSRNLSMPTHEETRPLRW